MPKRNAVKMYGADQYYHVYNRGVNKSAIFVEDIDRVFFLSLFKRHLTPGEEVLVKGRVIPNYAEQIELVAYCLMRNHFHLLVYLKEADGLEKLMRSVMTAYSMYFNYKYNRSGGLFEGRFLASRITSDAYLWHVSRYIHLNPLDAGFDYREYPYSSLDYYLGYKEADWLHPERLVATSMERQQYGELVAEGVDWHELYHKINHELANADND